MTTQPVYQGLKYSILPDQLSGTMYITGFRGRGKSTLAAHSEDPDLIAFYDFDDGKGLSLHKQLNFGLYRDMVGEGTAQYGPVMTSEQVYNFFHKAITDLPSGRFTVLVIDNIDWLERGLAYEVAQRPAAYGVDPAKAKSGTWGGVWPGVNNLVSSYISAIHGKGVRLVIATAHVKPAWASSGPIPNKYKVRGVDRWQQMSALTIALIPGSEPLIPVGVVYKQQLAVTRYNRDTRKHETVNPLPLRIPICTFENIRGYITNPADLSNPKPGEVPTEEELGYFGDKFTREQLTYVILSAKLRLKGDNLEGENGGLPADFPQFTPSPVDGKLAQSMLDAGATPIDVAAHFTKELATTINIGDIFRATTEYAKSNGSS